MLFGVSTEMRLFVAIFFAVVSVSSALPQHQHQQVDPAYLRQYYQQLAQQQGGAKATPIYETQEQQYEQPKAVSLVSPLTRVATFFFCSY